ncbi:kinetochore protein spc24 [Xylariales sp. AK1849]|nr:kinetochore protein spc24 [Xylariales sp. AK1849]
MLLDEDPATLIRHTINSFHIVPDKTAISRIHDSLSTLQSARDLRVTEAESSLKKLSRTLHTLQSQHEELLSTHSSTAHASEIARLDTQKFRTAKATSDLEMEGERLASTAADLGARLQELELQGVEGGAEDKRRDTVEDEVLLRLKVYRSLGIEIERDGKDGEFAKAVVRNDRKGDVHVVNMDKKFSRFFYANYFWQTLA